VIGQIGFELREAAGGRKRLRQQFLAALELERVDHVDQ
jgi:hypothetical protein